MIKLDFNTHCPKPGSIEGIELPKASFLSYRADIEQNQVLLKEYSDYPNIIIIGHGGSVTTFMGIYGTFKDQSSKNVNFVSTVDPDLIYSLKNKYSPSDTLVIAISKSGETTTQLEALLQFTDYPLLFITGENSVLEQIAHQVGGKVIIHPEIGGRYTGLTEVAQVPALLCGFDSAEMVNGATSFYEKYEDINDSFKLASVMWQLEQTGYVDVYLPIYSSRLYNFTPLITQLCHESFAKNELGQSFLAYEGPEAQHHTNQRFFGGRKNIAGLGIKVENFKHDTETIVPLELSDIAIKGNSLNSLNNIMLSQSFHYELSGVAEDAEKRKIPFVTLSIDQISYNSVGQWIAFWQLYAVYSSVLRGLNPFDQPEVESSKNLSFSMRLERK